MLRVFRLAASERPCGVKTSRDGRRLYVATGRGNTILNLDSATGKRIASTPVGNRVWNFAFTPDRLKLYAANGLSNDVSVIDTRTNRVVATVAAGDGPWGVAVTP